MPPSPDKKKAFDKAVSNVFVAQNRLVKHQIEMHKMQANIAVFHAQMTTFAAVMGQHPSQAPMYAQSVDKWVKATNQLIKLQVKEPKLIMMLDKANNALTKAAKDMQ